MRETAGLYVHVPFCRHRCHFCAFLISTHTDFLERWEAAVIRELLLRAPDWRAPFDTIYFGGGTPSLVPPAAIGRILDAIRNGLDVAEASEISLEANPGDLDEGDLADLRRLGVNRLSLGIQSTDDGDLRFLTRDHSAEDGRNAFLAARRAGFSNITIDLMYGLPTRTKEQWRERLHQALDLGPDHVSAYQLTFEPGTPFKRFRDTGRIAALSEEEERERFLLTRAWLSDAGYEPYEVSSFARAPAFESRHNWKYWSGAPYLGIGPAAHAFDGEKRWWNIGAVRNYVRAIEEGRSAVERSETPTEQERLLERLFLELRTARGVKLTDVPASPKLSGFVSEGLVLVDGERLRLTEEGFAVADGIALELSR